MERSQSSTDSDRSDTDNTYCVFLRIFEAVGVVRPSATVDTRPLVLVTVTLNGVKFEVEGHSTELSTIFNSNCIWECDLKDLRRMRSDNRPIKLECFLKNCELGNSGVRMVGSMLLPIRNVPIISQQRGLQINMHWHKLSTLHSEWRQTKPEVLLYLTIVKKNLIEGGQLLDFLDTKKQPSRGSLSPMSSETSMMLRSQSNIYVQLLDQVGLIQVGNNPDVDCDIITVWMKMHQLRNVRKLVEFEQSANAEPQKFLFHFNLLGTVWNKEFTANADDMYLLGNKVSLSFKSSVKSLRLYFQRIFYIPVVLYHNGHIIANFRFDFNKYMPADEYFNGERNWVHNGTFHFDRLHKALSPHLDKPSVDFVFKFTLVTVHSNKIAANGDGVLPLNDHFVRHSGERDFLDAHSASSRMELTRRSEVMLSAHTSRDGGAEYIVVNTTAFESTEDDLCAAVQTTEGACMPDALDLRSYLLNSHLPKPRTAVSIGTSMDAALMGDDPGDNGPPSTLSVATGMDPILTYDVALCTERVETVSVATETDSEAKNEADTEELTVKVVRELEEWKAHQMECFVQQLERKKAEYLAGVKQEWKRHRNVMQARFEAEAEEAVQARLLALQPTRDDLLKSVQQEIGQQYACKFETLEMEIERLKVDMREKSTSHALQEKDMQLENTRLVAEKRELEQRIDNMRQKLVFMEKTTMSSGDLKKVLTDLRVTNERYAKLEKSKNDYQQLWTKATRDVKRLKMDALKEKERTMREKTESSGVGDFELSIEELLSDEHEALRSDRSELEAIKDILLETCGPEEDL